MRLLTFLSQGLRLVRSFRPRSILPYIGIILLFVCVWKVDAEQPLYQFSGVYSVGEVLPSYCSDCALSLPSEYLDMQLVLSVRTDDRDALFTALKSASLANGWKLTKQGKSIKATKDEDKGRIYLSCWDSLVHRVPSDEYRLRLQSDSIKCLARDNAYRLSLTPPSAPTEPLSFQKYRLEYVAFNKTFSDRMGVKWQEVLARGNLKSRPTFYDSWQLQAIESNDTNFTIRTIEFSLDTSITVDWGNEKQVPERTFSQDGGVVTTSYEWRKYGLSVFVKKDDRRIKLDYTIRNDDNGTLTGKAVGSSFDSLALNGNYRYTQRYTEGVPFLSRIPFLGYLFSVQTFNTDYKHFEIYLYPIYQSEEE